VEHLAMTATEPACAAGTARTADCCGACPRFIGPALQSSGSRKAPRTTDPTPARRGLQAFHL